MFYFSLASVQLYSVQLYTTVYTAQLYTSPDRLPLTPTSVEAKLLTGLIPFLSVNSNINVPAVVKLTYFPRYYNDEFTYKQLVFYTPSIIYGKVLITITLQLQVAVSPIFSLSHTTFILQGDNCSATVFIHLDRFHVSAVRTQSLTFKQQLKVILRDLWRQICHRDSSPTQRHLLRQTTTLTRTDQRSQTSSSSK